MEVINEIQSVDSVDSIPRVGMEFDTLDKAWNFWVSYGGKIGFNTRKEFKNQKKDGPITSRGFVCSNGGYRTNDRRNREVKRPRAETRTGCDVRFSLKLIRETQKYRVYDFHGEHNHILQRCEAIGLMPSQRKISEPHGMIIDLADDSGIRPREAYELMGREVGGRANLSFTKRDLANRLRDNRKKNLAFGEAAGMLRYFYNQTLKNSSFRHIEDLDDEGRITNVFWTDAKMLIDYAHFGDVITFDTTYSTNKEFRPLGVFVGFNHFREITVFGVTLLYNETIDSFKWLFEIFLATHNYKHPKTIFTDQDPAMAAALKEIMPNTYHGLCTWHISQNAIRNLTGKKENEGDMTISGKEILKTFKACMYDYDNEKEFTNVFNSLISKVRGTSVASEDERMINVDGGEANKDNEVDEEEEGNLQFSGDKIVNEKKKAGEKRNGSKKKVNRENWLNFIFKVKEKWAKCYMKDVVTLGMRSTQLSESFNKDLKSFLKWNMDITRFFKHFDRVLEQKRAKEVESEYEMRKKQPRVKVAIPILQQAGALYTPKVFEIFQNEWELSMAAFVKSKIKGSLTTEYCIGISTFGRDTCLDKYFQVVVNHASQTVICSCNKFKRTGVLCGHTLKVFDVMNVKLIPENYIVKRWTREAQSDIVQDFNGETIVENPKLDSANRYRVLARKLLKLAARAADFEEVAQFVDNASDILGKKIEEKIQNLLTISTDGAEKEPLLQQPNLGPIKEGFLMDNSSQNSISFKKKEGRKSGKHLENWVEKLTKAKKGKSAKAKGQNGDNASQNELQHQICKGVETSNSLVALSAEPEEYGYFNSYIHFLKGGSCDALPFFGEFMTNETTNFQNLHDASC